MAVTEADAGDRIVLRQITAIETQRFAVSVNDLNPLYFDDEFARSHGYRGMIAPPTFLAAMLGWNAGPLQSELLPDGNNPDAVPDALQGRKMMGGGQKLSFHEPVYPGDTISCSRELVGLTTKMTRRGPAVFAVSRVRYFNQHGCLVLSCEETLIARS